MAVGARERLMHVCVYVQQRLFLVYCVSVMPWFSRGLPLEFVFFFLKKKNSTISQLSH